MKPKKSFLRSSNFFKPFALGLVLSSSANAATLVSENFGGLSSANLNGTTAETFDSGITSAGGSATWVASTPFKADGSASYTGSGGDNGRSAHLSMGSYINDAKGTSTGKFILEVTLDLPTGDGSWFAFGFAKESSPATLESFNEPTEGTTGTATMLYRPNGDIDQFAPFSSSNQVAADDVLFSGTRTLTITLDLTMAGGYNGVDNFGTVFFGADTGTGGTYQEYGSYTYNATDNTDGNVAFGSLLLSIAATSIPTTITGDYDSLTLTQIPEPSAALLGGLGLLALLRRRR